MFKVRGKQTIEVDVKHKDVIDGLKKVWLISIGRPKQILEKNNWKSYYNLYHLSEEQDEGEATTEEIEIWNGLENLESTLDKYSEPKHHEPKKTL